MISILYCIFVHKILRQDIEMSHANYTHTLRRTVEQLSTFTSLNSLRNSQHNRYPSLQVRHLKYYWVACGLASTKRNALQYMKNAHRMSLQAFLTYPFEREHYNKELNHIFQYNH